MHLVVTEPFGEHARGDAIIEPIQIEEVLAGEHQHKVVRVDAPAPQAE